MAYLDYDEYDFAKIKTAKQLAQFILNITDRDEVPYGEMLDMIDEACRYVKKNKNTTKGACEKQSEEDEPELIEDNETFIVLYANGTKQKEFATKTEAEAFIAGIKGV